MLDSASLQPILFAMGHPAAGGPWQFVMERTLAAAGFDWRFLTLDVAAQRLEVALAGAAAMGFVGGILRAPHDCSASVILKQISHAAGNSQTSDPNAESPSEPAAAAASDAPPLAPTREPPSHVDFLFRDGDSWGGRYLLGEAVVAAVRKHLPTGQEGSISVMLWGEGVLADGLRLALQAAGAEIHGEGAAWAMEKCCALIDAREHSDQPPLAHLVHLPKEAPVIDAATPTSFSALTQAAAGRPITSGLDLAVEQASTAFRTWTGQEPDLQVLREAFEEFWEI